MTEEEKAFELLREVTKLSDDGYTSLEIDKKNGAAIKILLAAYERQKGALLTIELISTNHGAWFENDPWEWGQMMGQKARAALNQETHHG